MNQETLNLLNRIDQLESDVRKLSKMNVDLAWSLNDKDILIELLRNQVNSLKEILEREGYYTDIVYN